MDARTELDLVLALAALHTRVGRRLAGALTPHGIGFTEFLVLRALDAAPERQLRRVDLAREVGLTASGVTRLLNPLEKIGMVRKEAAARDARVSLVALSESGARVRREAEVSLEAAAVDLLRPLAPDERDQLRTLLERLA